MQYREDEILNALAESTLYGLLGDSANAKRCFHVYLFRACQTTGGTYYDVISN